MKRFSTSLLFVCFLMALQAKGQYYFNDIVAPQQASLQHRALTENGVKQMTATSYESNNMVSEGFFLTQKIMEGGSRIETLSGNKTTRNFTVNLYQNNRILKSEDSTSNILTITTYQYNDDGLPVLITISSADTFMNSRSEEKHLWLYDADKKPLKMIKVKDGADTTFITFIKDEAGNIAAEKWQRKKRIAETYYYYYNAAGLLTDIVRFNHKAQRLLPDFLYAYDEAGRVKRMTQMPANSSDYLVWEYSYHNNGLKESESIFNKNGALLGRIVFSYK